MSHSHWGEVYEYRDLGGFTTWVKYLIYLQVVISVIALWGGWQNYSFFSTLASGFASDDAMIAANEAAKVRQQWLMIGEGSIYIISSLFILSWVYRANENVHALGAEKMEFNPLWSIGWYFIPVFNFWKPYQAMAEIWRGSHNPAAWRGVDTPTLMALWWFLMISSFLASNIAYRLMPVATEPEQMITVNNVSMASDVGFIALAFVTISLLSRIHQAQAATAAAKESSD